MSDELLNILSNSNKDIDNQKLMDYLSNKLSQEEKHAFEMEMADSNMLNEAVEGLEGVADKNKLQEFTDKLNADLQKRLGKKKSRREKLKLKDQPWLYFAIIIILLLLVICFVIIKIHLGWAG
jgi:hypothetical protein